MPSVRAATSAGSLLFREKDASFGRTGGRSLHRYGIGRANLVIVMKVFAENCPLDQGRQNIRQQQVGDSLQTIPGCRVSRDISTQAA